MIVQHPQRYRKRPVVIEAALFDGSEEAGSSIVAWAMGAIEPWGQGEPLRIVTLEGTMEALPGDYVIKGLMGEFYPCKATIFQASYEPEVVEP